MHDHTPNASITMYDNLLHREHLYKLLEQAATAFNFRAILYTCAYLRPRAHASVRAITAGTKEPMAVRTVLPH